MYYQIFSVSFHSQLQELSLWNHSAGTIGDPSLELHCSNPTSCIQKGLLNLDYTVVLAWRWVSPCQGQEDGTGTGKEKKQTSSRPMSGTEEERGGGGCHHELLQNKIFNKCLFRNILILLSLKLTKTFFTICAVFQRWNLFPTPVVSAERFQREFLELAVSCLWNEVEEIRKHLKKNH